MALQMTPGAPLVRFGREPAEVEKVADESR